MLPEDDFYARLAVEADEMKREQPSFEPVNGDITYWHSQLAHEFNVQNISAKMTKQIQRMEMQRDRLLEFRICA